ncbi:MAG: hypothetical protein ACOWWR_19570 [Eubacteriales bacterium]
MNGKELFEGMEGYEYFKSQLTEIPEEERDAYAGNIINFIANGFMV